MLNLAQAAAIFTGAVLSPAQMAALATFEQQLQEWNQRINLTAIEDVEQIRTKHFLDSLSCFLAFRGRTIDRIIDVGTGAGFPGIPLKIVAPSIRLTLVESVGKKADFCRHIVNLLGLTNVNILQLRAEEIGQMPAHREKYDIAVARAVAGMPVLAEYLLPLVRVGGAMLAMKGENAPQETHTALNTFKILGGCLHKLIPVTLPGVVDERYLVVVDKVAATPHAYPRRVGLPAKKPL